MGMFFNAVQKFVYVIECSTALLTVLNTAPQITPMIEKISDMTTSHVQIMPADQQCFLRPAPKPHPLEYFTSIKEQSAHNYVLTSYKLEPKSHEDIIRDVFSEYQEKTDGAEALDFINKSKEEEMEELHDLEEEEQVVEVQGPDLDPPEHIPTAEEEYQNAYHEALERYESKLDNIVEEYKNDGDLEKLNSSFALAKEEFDEEFNEATQAFNDRVNRESQEMYDQAVERNRLATNYDYEISL